MSAARLLVVDDEAINRDIIAEYLEDTDYQLAMAAGGEEALVRLRADAAFDAIILDRMMPGVDGLAVLKQIQADAGLRHVPVIMQTAAAGHEQVAEGLRLGAYYYLTKPYHRDALLAVVRSALEMVQRRRALTRAIDEFRGIIGLIVDGRFRVKSLQEARALAAAISSLGADPVSVALGLSELMINGIEHGNLGISFHEKAELLAADRWEAEIQTRLASAAHSEKFIEVCVRREPGALHVASRDQGPGFDWRPYLDLSGSRALYPNGRGIAMARHVAFRNLRFIEPGNEVVATLAIAD
jgi:CheY-like chemotaxis protein/anti-sigma regulatory factor (Ser/Thr protein kinase)